MNDENGKIFLDKSNDKYDGLKLSELKELARSQNIEPEGNLNSKNTWISALKDAQQNKSSDQDLNFGADELENPGSPQAQESIFDSVLNKLEQRGVNLDTLSLSFDGQEALSYQNGDVNKNTLTDKQSELLQSALNDPQNFEGTVTIKSGNKTLLKIENGQVTRDAIGLTSKSTQLEVESSAKSLYDKYSQQTRSKGLGKTREVTRNAINDGISSQQAKKIIQSQDAGYKGLSKSIGVDNADKSLDKIVNQAVSQKKIREKESSQTKERETEQSMTRSR